MIKLYSYFRSSSSYRVRIALNIKNLPHEIVPVHLLNNGGEQFSEEFSKLNKAHRIPVIVHDDRTIAQSVAIMEYLDASFPEHPLYPRDEGQKALARQLIEIINSDIQPLQNLSVLKKLVKEHGFSEEEKVAWIKHWITLGFESFESLLESSSGNFCMGDSAGVVDCYLVPQVYNAVRFGVDMSRFPKIAEINERCLALESFQKAHPDNQLDTPTS